MLPAQQTVGRVTKARHLHVIVGQGLGVVFALRNLHVHNPMQWHKLVTYSDLYMMTRGGLLLASCEASLATMYSASHVLLRVKYAR
jgi:hypothetical protein